MIDAAAARVDTRLAEEQQHRDRVEQDSFARRASLLIEQLNSASIDLTRTLAPDVSDSAWAAYLKGDRGVFTRRAVRLLDAAEQTPDAGRPAVIAARKVAKPDISISQRALATIFCCSGVSGLSSSAL